MSIAQHSVCFIISALLPLIVCCLTLIAPPLFSIARRHNAVRLIHRERADVANLSSLTQIVSAVLLWLRGLL